MNNTLLLGSIAIVAALAAGIATVGPAAVRLAAAPVVSDHDEDTIPDDLELELCDRGLSAMAVKAAGLGHCASATDWVPPQSLVQTAFVPTRADWGEDHDADGLPATITLEGQDVTFNPFSKVKLSLAPAPPRVVAIDSGATGDDTDAQRPVLSSQKLPIAIPMGAEELRDADQDGLPSSVHVKMAFLTIDRTAKGKLFAMESAPGIDVTIDGQDADPAQPVTHRVQASYVPTMVWHDGDEDEDLVPHALTIHYVNVTVDRRVGVAQGNRILLSSSSLTQVLDADDSARDNMIQWSLVDKDVDLVPDEVEPVLCMMEKKSDPDDGSCDETGDDFQPSARYQNPWHIQR